MSVTKSSLPFIHLRNHSYYSLCQGAIRINELVDQAKNFSMPAVALTDIHNLYGSLQFSNDCLNAGIQPIIGCDTLIDFGDEFAIDIKNSSFQIVLLMKNEKGRLNLLDLVSDSYIKSQGLQPKIALNKLLAQSSGLIALSGGEKGIFGNLIKNDQALKAKKLAEKFKEIFGNKNFYIELQRHENYNANIEKKMIDIAYEIDVPLVATNDCYFLTEDAYEAQDILSCIGTNRYVLETDRSKLTSQHYFKNTEEMLKLFADIPEAINNTVNIAKRCCVFATNRPPTLPKFSNDNNFDEAAELRKQARDGLEKRMKAKFAKENIKLADQNEIKEEYQKRLEYELDVIIRMNFPGYFLIVSDFIIWSKKNNIPVGPGRGSGAGSVVAWSLQITDLDPIRFGLLFERFLNPQRVSMPDFDIDFCQSRRDEVISYVKNKYGSEMVAQIITFGTLQARAALKDVGRVLQMPYSQVDRICKTIPFNAIEAVTLSKAIEMDGDLQKSIKEDPQIKKLVDISLKLEGLYRHSSTHAAGIVIGDKPLRQICQLYLDAKSDIPAVGYSMKYAEASGLVKFDFLGLKTLTVIAETVKLVKQNRNIDINISEIDINDKETFAMLALGDTVGVFQIESAGMRSALRRMKADKFEDIIALISLYRPGPMDNIPTYVKRKNGLEKIEYPDPLLAKCLEETYGVIVYQEQVMEIAKILAGYSLGDADLLRRAMGKKIKKEMDEQREIFIAGCHKTNGISKKKAGEIFDLVAKFAGYGFNKSHAAAYAMISYQTAWLKCHFTVEFIIASINLDIDNTDKINIFIQEAKNHNIEVLPPDINKSEALFSVEKITK